MRPAQRCVGKSHTGRAGPPPPPLSPSRPLIEAATHVVVALISVFAIKTSQDKGKPTVADGENIHARPSVVLVLVVVALCACVQT